MGIMKKENGNYLKYSSFHFLFHYPNINPKITSILPLYSIVVSISFSIIPM